MFLGHLFGAGFVTAVGGLSGDAGDEIAGWLSRCQDRLDHRLGYLRLVANMRLGIRALALSSWLST